MSIQVLFYRGPLHGTERILESADDVEVFRPWPSLLSVLPPTQSASDRVTVDRGLYLVNSITRVALWHGWDSDSRSTPSQRETV